MGKPHFVSARVGIEVASSCIGEEGEPVRHGSTRRPSFLEKPGRGRASSALALAGLALLAPPEEVSAQSEQDEPSEICPSDRLPFESPAFERFDRDGDGRLTIDEAARCAPLETVFSRLDLDADQALTRAEYRGFADVWRRRRRTFDEDAD